MEKINSFNLDYILTYLAAFMEALRWQDLLDILLVSIVLYQVFFFIRGTRAVQLIRGLLLLVLGYYLINNFLELKIMSWLLQNATTLVIVAIPVLFQPELRRALSQLGKGFSLLASERILKGEELFEQIHQLASTVRQMSEKKMGCLLILERNTGLNEYIETGTPIDADISNELLLTLFYNGTPLHDGAVIIRRNRIVAASVVLPLTDSLKSPAGIFWGTRHRAAIGLSEVSDAVCLVVSEETGNISLVLEGKIHRNLTEESLYKLLLEIFQAETEPTDKRILKNIKTQLLPKVPGTATSKFTWQTFIGTFNLRLISLIIAIVLGLVVGMGSQHQFGPKNDREMLVPVVIKGQKPHSTVKLEPPQVTLRISFTGERLKKPDVEQIEVFVQVQNETGQVMLPIGVSLPPEVELKHVEPKNILATVTKLKS